MKKQWIPILTAAVLTLSACGAAAPVAPDSAQSAFVPAAPAPLPSAPETAAPETAAPEIPSAPSEGVTEADARRIALEHAGLSENDVSALTFFKTEKEFDDGRAEYEIKFSDGSTKYDYTIDAETGAILSFEADDAKGNVKFSFDAPPSEIGPEEAKAIALAHAGVSESDATRLEVKRDRDDGRTEYEVEFYVGRTEYSYEIDAASGEILSFEADND